MFGNGNLHSSFNNFGSTEGHTSEEQYMTGSMDDLHYSLPPTHLGSYSTYGQSSVNPLLSTTSPDQPSPLTPVITTTDESEGIWPSSFDDLINFDGSIGAMSNCSPNSGMTIEDSPSGLSALEAYFSDCESPVTASGSDSLSFHNPSPVSHSNGFLTPYSQAQTQSHVQGRRRSQSDTRPGVRPVSGPVNESVSVPVLPSSGILRGHGRIEQGQVGTGHGHAQIQIPTASLLLAPPVTGGHRRTQSWTQPNPQYYRELGNNNSHYLDPHAFSPSSLRGRPVSRTSSLSSRGSSRRMSPYGNASGSNASSPGWSGSDMELPSDIDAFEAKQEGDDVFEEDLIGTGSVPLSGQPGQPLTGMNIPRRQVTTPAIHAASLRRREKPAPHRCPLCGTDFTRKSNLRGHLTAHSGEKPQKCTFPGCTKAFARVNDLKRHSKIHEKDLGEVADMMAGQHLS